MEREVGGGIGMGNTCKPMAVSFQCMTKFTTNKKKKKKKKKEMGIPDHSTCLPPEKGQEATVRSRHGTKDWFQIGKGVHQDCILSPCLFNLYAEYTMRNARLGEAQV